MAEQVYYVYPMRLSQANMAYYCHHRHLNRVQGHHMSFLLTGTKDYFPKDDCIERIEKECRDPFTEELAKYKNIGVLTIGRPVGRFKNKNISEVTRICFNPTFKPRGRANSLERTLPSRFVMKAFEIYKSYYPNVSAVVTYIGADENGMFLRYAGFALDKIIKPRNGWIVRGEKRMEQTGNFYGWDSYEMRKADEQQEIHHAMNKEKFRLIKIL